MSRWVLAAALLLLASMSGEGQRGVPAFTEREDVGNLARAVMRNGLTLLVEEHVAGPVGSLVTRVNFGSLDYPEAPLAAELLARRAGRKLAAEVRGLGGILEFEVHPHHTLFVTTAADSNVFRAVQAQAALLAPPEDDGQLSLDLAVLQSGVTPADSPYGQAMQELAERVYTRPPAPDSDSEESQLTALPVYSVELLDRLQKTFYRPPNMVLAASGSVRRERILREAVRSMAAIEPGEAAVEKTVPTPLPESNSFKFSSVSAPVLQNYVFFGYPIPGQHHEDRTALDLLVTLLGRGRGALLRLPRPESGHPSFTVDVGLQESARGSLFTIIAVPWPGQIDATEVQVLATVETLLAKGIPPAELDRAKAQWVRHHYTRMQRVDDRAKLLAQYEILGNYKGRDSAAATVAAMTAEQLLKIARRYLRRDRMVVQEILTTQQDPRTFTAESFLETVDLLVPEQRNKERVLLDLLRADQEKSQFKLPAFRPRYSRPTLRQTAILRGPDIWIRERHLLPLATVGFFFSGGRIQETDSTAGITETMFRALLRALTRRDDGLRYHRLERGGVSLEAVSAADYFGLRIVTLSRQLNEVVQRITNWLRDPDTQIEATDLEAARNAILAESRLREDAFPHELLPAVRRGLYGDHPYGSEPGPGSLSSLQLSQVQSWATRQLVNVHPYLLVLGDFEGTSFLQGLISQLSDRRYEVRKKFEHPFDFDDDSHGRAASGQHVLMGLPGPEAHTYSRQVLDVAGWLLGGWQGTISRRLQDQKLASRLTLFTEAGLNGGGLFIGLEADPSRSREAAEALQNLLNQLDGNSFGQGEHFDALVATITRRHLLVEDSRLLLHDLMLAVLSGENAGYRSREEGIIKSLTPAEVLSTARRYFVFPQ